MVLFDFMLFTPIDIILIIAAFCVIGFCIYAGINYLDVTKEANELFDVYIPKKENKVYEREVIGYGTDK